MKQLFRTTLSSLVTVGLMVTTSFVVGAQSVYAVDCTKTPDVAACKLQSGVNTVGGTTNSTDLTTFITNIINVLLFVAGAIAVVMIILGAIRYITSNGDQADIKAAKDTIMYSVIGLVVSGLAYAIVNFIVSRL